MLRMMQPANGSYMDRPDKVLGKNLARILLERGWKQADFAQKIGRSSAYVSRIIGGHSWVSGEVIQAIAEAAGVHYSDLLAESETPTKPLTKQSVTITEALRVVNAYEGKLNLKIAQPKHKQAK